MARINIEDSVFKEKSFEKLMLKLGSRRAALGALVEAYMLAQKHYVTTVNDRLIPFDEWEREEIAPEILECNFAEKRDKGIYVRGSDEQFKWLLQRSEAGKSSARNKQQKKKKSVQRPLDDRSTTADGSQPLTLTPSLTPTLSLSTDSVSILPETGSGVEILSDKDRIERNRKIWESYRSAFNSRYKLDPTRNAKVNSLVNQLRIRLGEAAADVVQFYVWHNDRFYLSKTHSLDFCVRDAESLMIQMQRGTAITSKNAAAIESKANMMDTLRAIRDGEV